jgi:hypothetical protein
MWSGGVYVLALLLGLFCRSMGVPLGPSATDRPILRRLAQPWDAEHPDRNPGPLPRALINTERTEHEHILLKKSSGLASEALPTGKTSRSMKVGSVGVKRLQGQQGQQQQQKGEEGEEEQEEEEDRHEDDDDDDDDVDEDDDERTERLVQDLLQELETEQMSNFAGGAQTVNGAIPRKKQITSGPQLAAQETVSESPQIKLLYITADDSRFQRMRIAALSAAFGAEFVVIWGRRESPKCPFVISHSGSLCVDFVEPTNTLDEWWAPGHECALLWSLRNQANFDYAWMMEDDVYETDMGILQCAPSSPPPQCVCSCIDEYLCTKLYRRVVRSTDQSDLILQAPLESCDYDSISGGSWWHVNNRLAKTNFFKIFQAQGVKRSTFLKEHCSHIQLNLCDLALHLQRPAITKLGMVAGFACQNPC